MPELYQLSQRIISMSGRAIIKHEGLKNGYLSTVLSSASAYPPFHLVPFGLHTVTLKDRFVST